jgi:DNA-binding CsgD family transcriptional regulator
VEQGEALERVFAEGPADPRRRLLVGQALLSLLTRCAADRVVLCAVDDGEHLDEASAETLAFIARRLGQERIVVLVAFHDDEGDVGAFEGERALRVEPLSVEAAHELLTGAGDVPLDAGVRDRLVAESGRLPLGLVELPRALTPEQLGGAVALPDILPAGRHVQARLAHLQRHLPHDARTLLLLAALERDADVGVFWTAAARLGVDADAATALEARGLIRFGRRIRFRHPLVRNAVYEAAPFAERRRAHEAFGAALDPAVDLERHAWHRAAAALVPDEEIAQVLEASAAGARSRRDDASAATLLERAAELSPDPGLRYARSLGAAQAAFASGALGRAALLLDQARPRPEDELQRAQAERLRAAIAVARGQGTDRVTMLLETARAFETLDAGLARDTYLEAFEAAASAGRLAQSATLVEVAGAARTAVRGFGAAPDAGDELLDALTLLVTAGHGAAAAAIRRALRSLRHTDVARWLPLAAIAAVEIWDDDALHDLAVRARTLQVGAVASLDDVLTGRFGVEVVGPAATPTAVLAAAWRGRSLESRALVDASMRDAFARGLGLHVAAAHHALALLELGLGRYEAALSAVREAREHTGPTPLSGILPDLVEAAVRSGEREVAVEAAGELATRVRPSGTDWALGVLARSRALVDAGAGAELHYREAIERLRRCRVAPDLARAHLLYGEWLRRERRRREAREELRTARDMFVFMGAQAFAERARVELAATGEQTAVRSGDGIASLTAQELQIAQLARDGASNADIAARLFISPRTVEYHLHKVFRKLDVSSRTQLGRALPEPEHAG